MTSIDERIKKLEEKLRQEKAKKELIENRKRKAQQEKNRKLENQRKYYVGAFVLQQLEKNGIDAKFLEFDSIRFADWLTRDRDRAYFDLPPLAKGEIKQIDQPAGFSENQT